MDSVEMVVHGFFGDPMFVFIQPDDHRRQALLEWYVPALLGLLEKRGRLDVVPERAAALWIPPDSKLKPPVVPRRKLLSAPFRIGPTAMQRSMEFAAAVDDASRVEAQGAWRLIHVAVDPAHRDQGHAAAVLSRTLDEAAATGRRCFVAATSEFAVKFFLSQGFEVGRHLRVEGLPQFWTMIREPRTPE
jgi:ribosomal protein S18 acetylase RimI-like enzyme